jgi:hypothetical protein
MLEILDDLENKGIYLSLLIAIGVIAMSGLFFGVTYFIMDSTHTALLTTDCVIDNNTLVDSCQDLFSLGLYPFLALRSVFIWGSFLFMFGLVFAMLILGYRSGSSPILLGVMVTFVAGITYLAIMLSNMYRTLVEIEVFRNMMVSFTVYNKIMLNFPWFVFFIGLFAVILGIVNFQKTSINTPDGEISY